MSVKVMARVWEHSTLKPNQLLLLLAFADYADGNGVCWPSIASAAAMARMSDRRAQRTVRALEASGELYVQPGGGRHKIRRHTNRYAIVCGLDQAAIVQLLTEQLQVDPPEAESLAGSLSERMQTARKRVSNGPPISDEERVSKRAKRVAKLVKMGVNGAARPVRTVKWARQGEGAAPPDQEVPPIPAAVQVWFEVREKWPARECWPQIAGTVGADPVELERWRQVLVGYAARGWNRQAVDGPLDYFVRGELPAQPNGAHAQRPRTNVQRGRYSDYDDYWAGRLAVKQREREAIDTCALVQKPQSGSVAQLEMQDGEAHG